MLKAEAFCAELLRSGFSFDQFIIDHASAFKRGYRNDIEKISYKYNETYQQNEVTITLNRDGIYDRLPEGLFHQTKGNRKTLTTKEMVDEYRRYREEERQARRFFQPIEQVLFLFSVLTLKKEQDLSLNMLQGRLGNELAEFWGIPTDLPEEPSAMLLRIMPWIQQVKGDQQLTAKALEVLLGKPVTISNLQREVQSSEHCSLSLGEQMLGADTVIGQWFEEPTDCWRVTIQQLTKEEVALYPEAQPYGRFLKQFEELFIPLTIDVLYAYEIVEQPMDTVADVLGFSLII
ncbi:MAG TPA: hypothetical protein VD794_07085 [Flavisolibacter sp.]|nr:hypothetical protein [Flavisolibacter sp.]